MATLEYFNGSAWVAESGLIKSSITEKMYSPKTGKFVISNRNNAAEANYKDFTQVRWTETNTARILFYGKVIAHKPESGSSFGQALMIHCVDNLYGLQTQKVNSVYTGAGDRRYRSGMIKDIIEDFAYTDGTIVNIGTVTSNKFETSAHQEGDEILDSDYTDSGKNVLRAIYELAEDDPWTSPALEGHGWSFYLDEEFSTGVTPTPTPDFHYFKRGARPVGGPTSHGLTISHGAGETNTTRSMLPDYEFPINPHELTTVVRVKYVTEDGEVAEVDNLYLVNHAVASSAFAIDDTVTWNGGSGSANIEYVSTNGSASYIVISNPTEGQIKNIPGATLAVASGSKTATANASNVSPPGILREAIQQEIEHVLKGYQHDNKLAAVERAAQILFSGGDTIVRGTCRIVGYPYSRFTGSATGTHSTTLIASGGDFVNKSVKAGDLAKNTTTLHTGTITGNPTATQLPTNALTSGWTSGNTYQIDVPVRAGHHVRIVNSNVSHVHNTDMLVTEFTFEEGPGAFYTTFQLLGNAKSRGIGPPVAPAIRFSEAIEHSFWQTPAAIGGTPIDTQSVNLDFSFVAASYRTVTWVGGTATFGDGSTLTINTTGSGSVITATNTYCYIIKGNNTLQFSTAFSDTVGSNKKIVAIMRANANTAEHALIVAADAGMPSVTGADVIIANELSAISANMGLLTTGAIRIPSGGTSTVDVGSGFTGFTINGERIAGYNSGTLQVELSATDGRITANVADAIRIGGQGGLTFKAATYDDLYIYHGAASGLVFGTVASASTDVSKITLNANYNILDVVAGTFSIVQGGHPATMIFDLGSSSGSPGTIRPVDTGEFNLGTSAIRIGTIFLDKLSGGGSTTLTIDGSTNLAFTGFSNVGLNPWGTGSGQTMALRFKELAAGGTDYIALKAPDATATYTMTLPAAAPTTSNQAILVSTAGVMTFGGAIDFKSIGTGDDTLSINASTGSVPGDDPDSSFAPSGWWQIDVGGNERYVPFYS